MLGISGINTIGANRRVDVRRKNRTAAAISARSGDLSGTLGGNSYR